MATKLPVSLAVLDDILSREINEIAFPNNDTSILDILHRSPDFITIGDIARTTPKGLMNLRGIGKTKCQEVADTLRECNGNLTLRMRCSVGLLEKEKLLSSPLKRLGGVHEPVLRALDTAGFLTLKSILDPERETDLLRVLKNLQLGMFEAQTLESSYSQWLKTYDTPRMRVNFLRRVISNRLVGKRLLNKTGPRPKKKK